MNRRTFLQAALSLIPAPLLARLPIAPVVSAPIVETMQDIVLRDLEPYFKSEPATQVDFVPIDDGVTFDSDGRNVVITAWGMAQLSEIDDICYDVTIDGVRQGDRGNGLFMACGKTPHVAFIYCTATPPSAGEHHYGIVQRVRNGTATTNARISVREVW